MVIQQAGYKAGVIGRRKEEQVIFKNIYVPFHTSEKSVISLLGSTFYALGILKGK